MKKLLSQVILASVLALGGVLAGAPRVMAGDTMCPPTLERSRSITS